MMLRSLLRIDLFLKKIDKLFLIDILYAFYKEFLAFAIIFPYVKLFRIFDHHMFNCKRVDICKIKWMVLVPMTVLLDADRIVSDYS